MFRSLEINTWRQIEKIDIKFHPKLTILTGANGSGKTTILNLLSSHFGWNIVFVGTPVRDKKSGLLRYITDFWKSFRTESKEVSPARHIIGSITYENSKVATLTIPSNDQTFQIQIAPQSPVRGLHIPSHRPVYTYQPVDTMPTQPITRQEAFNSYFNEIQQRYMGASSGRKPNFFIKQTLLSLATYGYGNEVVIANLAARKLFEEFQDILRKVLPPKLGFRKIQIEMPEVLLVTKSGNFPLDSVSGGIASIIDISWQIFMFSDDNNRFVVAIDEPENHLHPELQQIIMPGFLEAFPQVQFVIATHNPLIISSVLDSYVYVLDFNHKNKVESKYLDFINKSGTANEILREVLGLSFTMPIWAERKLEQIVRKYSQIDINERSLTELRIELKKIGLEDFVPDAIAKLVKEQQKR